MKSPPQLFPAGQYASQKVWWIMYFKISSGQQHGVLSLPCRNNIAQRAMLPVVLDLRPLSFTENQEGMACLLQAVLQAEQSIPLGVTVNKKGTIPS